MTQQAARKFSPIFVATITPASIEVRTSAKGDEYVVCKGAEFTRNGQDVQTRTAMAFGQSASTVRDLLVEGKPVELAVQFDGGTVKMIGAPRPAQIEANDSKPAKRPMSKKLLQACIEASGFDQNDRYDVAA